MNSHENASDMKKLSKGLLELALNGRLTEKEAILGLQELGADDRFIKNIGIKTITAEKSAGIMSLGKEILLPAITAFLIASGALISYDVSAGDTIDTIAAKNGCSTSEIIKINRNSIKNGIKKGMKIAVPMNSSVKIKYHTVKKGESLWSIAMKHGCKVDELKKINADKIKKNDVINTGMKLIIPEKNDASEKFSEYTVSKGDSLWSIAKKYGCKVDELKKINADKIKKNDVINPGMKLIVPSGKINEKKEINEKKSVPGAVEYIIKKNDSFSKICQEMGFRIKDILGLNKKLTRGTILRPGMKIMIPAEPTVELINPNTKSYIVENGDTPSIIAKRFEITLEKFFELNPNIKKDSSLEKGQKINVGIDARTDYLARVIYSETAITTENERKLVCRVILNRIGKGGFSNNENAYSIVRSPYQFSCTSGTDGNSNWKEYHRNLNSRTRQSYEFAKNMMKGSGGEFPKTDDLYYCNKELGINAGYDKKSYTINGEKKIIGHPKDFDKNCIPSKITEKFIFYKLK